MTQRCFVTGGAGFVGSNLVDALLARGVAVTVYDNLSTGFPQFLADARRSPLFSMIEGDALDGENLTRSMAGCDFIYHLSANADVRHGTDHPRKDIEQNTLATFNVLEAARLNGVNGIAFASTGSIYGEPEIFPTPEDAPFPVQTSLYGASKLAGEGLIQAYAEGFGIRGYIFRFVSVLGERYTHGHVRDFVARLSDDPDRLYVLGDGHQCKSYMYVGDCIEGMMLAVAKAEEKINIFNLGTEESVEINRSIGWITKRLGLKPVLEFAGGSRGWIGDSPRILLDTRRIRALGWKPRMGIEESVVRTVDWLTANRWVMGAKK